MLQSGVEKTLLGMTHVNKYVDLGPSTMLDTLKDIKKVEDTVSSHVKLSLGEGINHKREIAIGTPEQSVNQWQMIAMLDNSKTGKGQARL